MSKYFYDINHITEVLRLPPTTKPLKQAKADILSLLEFSHLEELNRRASFKKDSLPLLAEYVMQEIAIGRTAVIRFIDDDGEKGGGYPIVSFNSQSAVKEFFMRNNRGQIGRIRITKENCLNRKSIKEIQIFWYDHIKWWWSAQWNSFLCNFLSCQPDSAVVSVFSSLSSLREFMNNFDNYQSRQVNLGGGFRLQADNVRRENEETYCDFSATVVFDDEPPRATQLSDLAIPRVTTAFTAKYQDGYFVPAHHLSIVENIIAQKDARFFSDYMLNKNFEKDGKALAILFGALFQVDPSIQTHSIEGIFRTLREENNRLRLITEIFDFDGTDTRGYWLKEKGRAYDRISGFMVSYLNRTWNPLSWWQAREALSSFVSYREVISNTSTIPEEVRRSICNHFVPVRLGERDSQQLVTLTKELTLPIALGRLARFFPSLDWQIHTSKLFEFYCINNITLFKFYIEDIDLIYWFEDGKFVLHKMTYANMMTWIKKNAKRIFEAEILSVHLHSLHEGD